MFDRFGELALKRLTTNPPYYLNSDNPLARSLIVIDNNSAGYPTGVHTCSEHGGGGVSSKFGGGGGKGLSQYMRRGWRGGGLPRKDSYEAPGNLRVEN